MKNITKYAFLPFAFSVIIYGSMFLTQSQKKEIINAAEVLKAPAILTASNVGTSSVLLSWIPVLGASGYKIYRSAVPEGSFIEITDAILPRCTVTGLHPGTDYWFYISAYNTNGTYTNSESIKVSTVKQTDIKKGEPNSKPADLPSAVN